jgi:hypothetical protein
MNIFETASREKYRFPSVKGELTVEQLWDLPLSKPSTRFDLDTVARAVNDGLEAITEKSFVNVKADSSRVALDTQLEIVKHIIAVKQDEEAKAKTKAANRVELNKLTDILAAKREESLASLSEEDLLKRIEELKSGA